MVNQRNHYTNIVQNFLFYWKSAGLQPCNPRKNKESRPHEQLSLVTLVILSLLHDKLDRRDGLTIALDGAEINAIVKAGNRQGQLAFKGVDLLSHHFLAQQVVHHGSGIATLQAAIEIHR